MNPVENSIIIASYQVILIFDNVFFQKTSSTGFGDFPQGSETILQGLEIFRRVYGRLSFLPSFNVWIRNLESNLKKTVDEIAAVESTIRTLKNSIWEKDAPNKVKY